MRHRQIKWVLWAFVALGFMFSLYSGKHRLNVEEDNGTVEIALDYAELRAIAAADHDGPRETPRSFSAILEDFRDNGAKSVAVEEDTIGGLEQSRRLTILPSTDRNATILHPLSPDSYSRIFAALTNKTHFQMASAPTGPTDILVHQPITIVRAVGVGLDPSVTAIIRRAGLSVLGRVGNVAGATPDALRWTLKELHDSGASTVVFTGDEVLGYVGPLEPKQEDPNKKVIPDALRANKLYYGTVEFGKQRGDVELQKEASDRTVRVHTILGTEMATAEMPSNVQRFSLAARERNIRVLFVRLFPSEPDPVKDNVRYVKEIGTALTHARLTHLSLGVAHGYGELQTNRWVRGLIGLGVAAAWLLLLDAVTRVFAGEIGSVGLIAGLILAFALFVLSMTTNFMGPKIVALAAGCIYPSLALLHNDALRVERGRSYDILVVALMRFAVAIGITFLGIAAIVGLLSDRAFLLKTDAFLGVKLVAIAPALVCALIYGLELRATERRSFRAAVGAAGASLRRAGLEPINLSQVAVAVVALALVVIVVMRSGNDPGVGVSPLELKFRSLLDHLMPARPRFKDMMGHPALLIAFVLAARGYRRAAFPFLLLGAVGLASMLDAFCHLHTPLPVSLSRDSIAIVIGLLIFLVIHFAILRPLLRRLPSPSATWDG